MSVVAKQQSRGQAREPWLAPWPLWTLRVVSVFYLYGALVHVANLAGWRPMLEGVDIPAHWVAADLIYLALDVAVVVGVWMRETWGIVAFLVAAVSQIVIYAASPDSFAIEAEHYAAIRRLVVFHVASLAIYGATVWQAGRQRPVTAA